MLAQLRMPAVRTGLLLVSALALAALALRRIWSG
jgi:hypothetical protein